MANEFSYGMLCMSVCNVYNNNNNFHPNLNFTLCSSMYFVFVYVFACMDVRCALKYIYVICI